jgi:hypothetical protein
LIQALVLQDIQQIPCAYHLDKIGYLHPFEFEFVHQVQHYFSLEHMLLHDRITKIIIQG